VVSIPASVEKIGAGAFYNCSSLSSVSVAAENSKYYVSGGCLVEKDSKTVIRGTGASVIPDDIKVIGYGAFSGLLSLESINIPASVVSMEGNAFTNCANLSEVHITDLKAWCNISVKVASASPLNGDAELYLNGSKLSGAVKIPEGVMSIPYCAFKNCTAVTNFILPAGVTEIGQQAFANTGIVEYSIPEGVVSIGAAAFAYCESLTSINFPASAVIIGTNPVRYCAELSTITVAQGNEAYYAENNCIVRISDNALIAGCRSTFPNTVTSISDYAFAGYGVENLDIPVTINEIGRFAFADCPNLKELIIRGGLNRIDTTIVDGCDSLESITFMGTIESIGISTVNGIKRLIPQETLLRCYPENSKVISYSRIYGNTIEFMSSESSEEFESGYYTLTWNTVLTGVTANTVGEMIVYSYTFANMYDLAERKNTSVVLNSHEYFSDPGTAFFGEHWQAGDCPTNADVDNVILYDIWYLSSEVNEGARMSNLIEWAAVNGYSIGRLRAGSMIYGDSNTLIIDAYTVITDENGEYTAGNENTDTENARNISSVVGYSGLYFNQSVQAVKDEILTFDCNINAAYIKKATETKREWIAYKLAPDGTADIIVNCADSLT